MKEKYAQSVAGIWTAFVMTWCKRYSKYSNRMGTYQGSFLTSDKWKGFTELIGVELRFSIIKSHGWLGIGDNLHSSLRRIFRKVRPEYPHKPIRFVLRIAVKSMKDTMKSVLFRINSYLEWIQDFLNLNTDPLTKKLEFMSQKRPEHRSIRSLTKDDY